MKKKGSTQDWRLFSAKELLGSTWGTLGPRAGRLAGRLSEAGAEARARAEARAEAGARAEAAQSCGHLGPWGLSDWLDDGGLRAED